MPRYCKNCYKTEEEHCYFDPVDFPEKCVCDPGTWDLTATITPICGEYVGDGIRSRCDCQACEHNKECHESNATNNG